MMTPRLLAVGTNFYSRYHTFTTKNPIVSMTPWIRKPMWTIRNCNDASNDEHAFSRENTSSSSSDSDEEEEEDKLRRHLSLFDLVCVGVGGTIGSGIFVLCGLISHSYAGPSTFISWGIAGLAACFSGVCFAELSGRIPSSGSSYVYSYIAIGELPAFLSAACLTLEYMVSGAAVARSWGDKVVEYMTDQLHFSSTDVQLLNPGWGINPMAFLVSSFSVTLLLAGIKETKRVTNIMSAAKVLLVASMCIYGFFFFHKENWTPLIPFGLPGTLRGSTSAFFGYVGYDEICCLAGEARNPRENLPKAILWVIAIVTILSMAASISLIGMQPFTNISDTSGFPSAFQWNGRVVAAQVFAAGEVLTLPIVVLVSLLAQPRLLYALSQDGLLPQFFGHVDATGNLRNSTLVAGISMTLISTFVPFTNLDDLISSGILVAFSMTNSSLILLRHTSPEDSPFLLEVLLVAFHAVSFALALLISHVEYSWLKLLCVFGLSLALVGVVSMIVLRCKESKTFGSSIPKDHDKQRNSCTSYVAYFQVPCMPYLPLVGAFINWYLLAQLQVSALLMLLLYFLVAVIGYFSYGYHHSYGNTQGWDYNKKEGILVAHDGDKAGVENENTFLHRVISLPQVGVREIT